MPTPAGKGGPAGVVVDDNGVRIVADDNGRKVTIQIDGRGIRVTEGAPAAAPTATANGSEVVLDGEAAADPEKMAEAIEAARSKIEEIVSDQVRQQVAQRTRVYQETSSDWFMTVIFLLIVTGIIVKIVLGSKRKAEVRAQAATATAAEEGLKRQLVEAQLKMMQAQVEPHFLFNTLASVDYLIETDPARASTMQKNLIQYLRAALPQMREGSTTLGKELSLCRAYLEILKVRMEDRLQFAITVPQGLSSARFPPMMLQSLVENAIKHGLEPKPEGGALTLTANVSHGMLRVTVADTGLGFGAGGTAGTGVGLANVRERLAALYGGQARLNVEANTPAGTIATIEVPYVIDSGATASAGPGPLPQPA
ncbi:MAG: histidine kinase [Burkholderiaceae bacterium]|nr:histidine kinase [Burkholderiaceae bacterium]